MSTAVKLMSAEEFQLLPNPLDGSKQELVLGEVITMPPAGGIHGVSCVRIVRNVGNFIDEHESGTLACNDTGFITHRGPDTVRGPDVAFWAKGRVKEVPVGYFEMPPDLAVEVLSPGNTSKQIRTKLREYFAKGVRMVWVVAPEDRTVTVYRTENEGRLLHESAMVSGEDVLPGFECRVSDLLP